MLALKTWVARTKLSVFDLLETLLMGTCGMRIPGLVWATSGVAESMEVSAVQPLLLAFPLAETSRHARPQLSSAPRFGAFIRVMIMRTSYPPRYQLWLEVFTAPAAQVRRSRARLSLSLLSEPKGQSMTRPVHHPTLAAHQWTALHIQVSESGTPHAGSKPQILFGSLNLSTPC